ncbi:bacteriohemerythrin [Desulfosediminicola flagellatus]|uniref:bacteriohemerythrin n=1 Tax=Desulfosediminicola flagellatus TaxID=2569541 RepID=UPI0010AD58CC|nr:bacteriohemerythrin [Desulfosediminicola flagellatus]
MPQIEWEVSFSIGDETIDKQHQKWIALYNKVDKMLLESNPTEFAEMKVEALEEMKQYALYHFSYEENFMKKINYPDLPRHWRLHKDFDYKVFELIRQIESGGILLHSELLTVMRDWLIEHILKEDMKIRQFQ